MFKKLLSILFVSYITSVSAFAANPPENIISMDQAQAIVTKVQAGEIMSKELEFEHHQWIYSFDIKASDNMIHEVQVDAVSGKIVSQTIETPDQESTEAAAEKQAS